MVRTQIQLREEQSATLKKLAAQQGVSVAELIRTSIDQFIHNRKEPTLEEKWERASNVIGMFSSGLSDLGTNHDDYLAETYGDYGE